MAKAKFERNKPHVNIGTIGHVDHQERGVYRIHQFEKQEMIVVCKPEAVSYTHLRAAHGAGKPPYGASCTCFA